MEYVKETDKAHSGYKYYMEIEDQTSPGDVKEYMGRLTKEQKAELAKYRTLLRQRRFAKKDDNKEIYNNIRKEYITNKRASEPEKMAAQNRKDVKNHRLRNKAKEQEILIKLKQTEAKQTITDAIRARKARAQLKELAEKAKTKTEIKDILNSIIDTIPKKAQQKRNKEAVKRHRAKKEAGQTTKTYNTRSKNK